MIIGYSRKFVSFPEERLYDNSYTPVSSFGGPNTAGEAFNVAVAGNIIGAWVYTNSDITGAKIKLYNNAGLVGSQTFSAPGATGWARVDFSSPLAISSSTTYAITVYVATGTMYFTANELTSGKTVGNLHILSHAECNGLTFGGHTFGGQGWFIASDATPNGDWQDSFYAVDPIFQQT